MLIFPSKLRKKFGLLAIINYLVAGFLVLVLIFASWLFLFIYKNIYFALVQEVAIINLKSQLVITKVQKAKFDELVKKIKEKQSPSTTINFKKLNNPFKGE